MKWNGGGDIRRIRSVYPSLGGDKVRYVKVDDRGPRGRR